MHLIKILKKQLSLVLLIITISNFLSCAESLESDNSNFYLKKNNITSGESLKIYSNEKIDNKVDYLVSLIDNNENILETYKPQLSKEYLYVPRMLNVKFSIRDTLYLLIETDQLKSKIKVKIEPSVILDSFCGIENCKTLSGNIVQNVENTLTVSTYKIKANKFIYEITTPYQNIIKENEYDSPVNSDWISNIAFHEVEKDKMFYIAKANIKAYNTQNGETAYTSLPFKVVRPIEVKHLGKHELAEVYEPVPVTGCIPGTIGSNVQYSESTSETRQNSVSITINKSWSDSYSSNETQSISEGISVGETQSTVNTSSISNSETQSESYSDTQTEGESNNISFNTSEGESWTWTLNESNSETEGQSQSQNTNTSVNASTTVGASGEGSLPFLAKASGKIEVSAGVVRGWGQSSGNNSSETNTESRGYSTNGSSQNGRTYGSVQNDSRSHSLSGAYVLSSSTSNAVSESSSLSSGRVWNMSESVSSGKVVTEGSGESIAQTVVSSNSSSTTFSYSGYIPRGRYGIFFRQTSRYVKLSEIITYDLNGFPKHAGLIIMNTWAWAPELSVSNTCEEAMNSNMPQAECLILPCR